MHRSGAMGTTETSFAEHVASTIWFIYCDTKTKIYTFSACSILSVNYVSKWTHNVTTRDIARQNRNLSFFEIFLKNPVIASITENLLDVSFIKKDDVYYRVKVQQTYTTHH